MSRVVSLATILSLLVPATAVFCQEKKDAPPAMVAPTPGPEHARLKSHEGIWDSVMTEADGKKSKGVMTYKMECGGLWLVSDFQGEHMGKPFHGKGLDSYDLDSKKYVGVWVDSWMTSPLNFSGTYDEKTKSITCLGECNGPDGKPMKMKLVTKTIDNDRETFEMYMVGPDGKDIKSAAIEYTRRKK